MCILPFGTSNVASNSFCLHCRYLVSGADESSLYLEVNSVDGCNVRCTAQNDAVMDGLLTVTHHSANESDKMSMQADLPLLSERDVHAIRDITSHFEVDFVSLTFTRDGEDVDGMRDFLDKLGLEQTKILAKVSPLNPLSETSLAEVHRLSNMCKTSTGVALQQTAVSISCIEASFSISFTWLPVQLQPPCMEASQNSPCPWPYQQFIRHNLFSLGTHTIHTPLPATMLR